MTLLYYHKEGEFCGFHGIDSESFSNECFELWLQLAMWVNIHANGYFLCSLLILYKQVDDNSKPFAI